MVQILVLIVRSFAAKPDATSHTTGYLSGCIIRPTSHSEAAITAAKQAAKEKAKQMEGNYVYITTITRVLDGDRIISEDAHHAKVIDRVHEPRIIRDAEGPEIIESQMSPTTIMKELYQCETNQRRYIKACELCEKSQQISQKSGIKNNIGIIAVNYGRLMASTKQTIYIPVSADATSVVYIAIIKPKINPYDGGTTDEHIYRRAQYSIREQYPLQFNFRN